MNYHMKGQKEMLLVENVDSREYLAGLFNAMYDGLPVHKANNKKKSLNNLYTFSKRLKFTNLYGKINEG